VGELLTAIYGACGANHQFPWPSHTQNYANTAIGNRLEQIRNALEDWRGHRDFIKSAQMPPCDYFIPDPPFIVEFDENQHFSRARLLTLNNYPANAQLGFPIPRWRELCREIDARDDKPFDRDERRAWYDVLRDWVPKIHGFNPTVRCTQANLTGVRSPPLQPQEPSDLWLGSGTGCRIGFARTDGSGHGWNRAAHHPAHRNVTISLNNFRMHDESFQLRRRPAKTFCASFVSSINGAVYGARWLLRWMMYDRNDPPQV
jgi:hypothetical protein